MSTSIEQRIVEMKFDNAAFSKGVDSTIQDLDKLDKATKFEGGKNGLKQLQVAADQVNFKQILSGINSIQDSLNHMQSFGFQVFQNLSNQAINWATTMVKSLSVDQIAGGFKEYELKMDSIKTIMNSSGASLDTVKEKLNELNTYSDKTIYSFSDMTSSIGKFTNAGVDLDSAVNAIQGISNQAALAGANANDASRAMYNFAQALSSGSVKLIDWKSIENANMATVDFKQSLIDTAVAMGTVVETEEGYKSTTTDANGKVSDLFTSTLGFNDALSSQWMTTDVLTQTLQNYATDTREMTDAEREAWVEKMKGLHYTDEQIARIEELGQKSFDAAQEVTTYSKMIDALREAVGSGWAQTFEILFGDLEEATKLWTGMNDVIGGIIASVADTRNGILELWKSWGGHTYLLQGLKEIYSVFKNVATYIGLAVETIFGHRFWGNFKQVQDFFKDRKGFSGNLVVIQRMANLLTNVSKKFFDITRNIAKYFNPKLEDGHRRLAQIYHVAQLIIVPIRLVTRLLTGIASKVLPVIAKAAAIVSSVILKVLSLLGAALTVGGLQTKLRQFVDFIVNTVGKAMDFISKGLNVIWWILQHTLMAFRLEPFLDAFSKGNNVFETMFNTIKTLGTDAYNAICNLIDSFAQLFGYDTIEDLFDDVAKTIAGAFGDSVEVATGLVEGLCAAFELLWGFLEPVVTGVGRQFIDWINGIGDAFESNPLMTKFITDVQNLGTVIGTIFSKDTKLATNSPTDKFNKLIKNGYSIEAATKKIEHMSGQFNSLGGFIDYASGKLDDFFTGLSNIGLFSSIKTIFNDLIAAFKTTNLGRIITGSLDPIIKTVKDTFKDFKLGDTFGAIGAALSEFFGNLKTVMANAPDIPTFFNNIKTSASVLYETIKSIVGPKFQEFLDLIDKLKQALNPKEALPDGSEEEVSQSVVGVIQGFISGLIKGIITFDWGKVISIFTAVVGVKFLKAIYDVLTALSSTAKGFTGLGKTVKKFTKNITDLIGAAKWQVMAESIFKIAGALTMLAAAIFVLALIPQENLQNAITALGAVTLFAVALMLVYGVVKKMTSEAQEAKEKTNAVKEAITGFIDKAKESFSKFTKLAGIAAIIISIGAALVMMAKVIAQFSGMPWGQFGQGIAMMGIVILTLAATFGLLLYISDMYGTKTDAKKMLTLALLILAISKSLQKMTKAVATLGSLDLPTLFKGVGAVVALMAAMTGMIKFIGGISADVKGIAAAMLVLSIALSLMVIPITAFALIPVGKLLKAIGAVAALIAAVGALAFISVYLKNSAVGLKEFGTAVLALIGVSVALLIFAAAIKMITDQGESIKQYAVVLVLLAAGFAAFAAILGVIGKFLGAGLMKVGLAMLFLGVGLLAAAAAVWVFAAACALFATCIDTLVASVSGREDEVVSAVSSLIFAAVKGIVDGLAYALVAIVAGLNDMAIQLRAVLPDALFNIGMLVLECIWAIIKAVLIAARDAVLWVADTVHAQAPLFWAKIQAGWAEGWRDFLALILFGLSDVAKRVPFFGGQLSSALKDVAEDLVEDGKKKSKEIIDEASAALEEETNSKAIPAATNAAQSTVEAYGMPFANPSNNITGFMDQTKEQITGKTPEVAAASAEAGQAVVDNFNPTTGIEEKSAGATDMLNMFVGEQQGLVSGQTLDFSSMYNGWPEGVSAGGDQSTAMLQQFVDQQSMTMGSQDFSDEALTSMGTYSTGIAASKDESTRAAEDVSKGAAEALKSGNSRESGKTFTQNFATGIGINKSAATEASKGVANSAKNSANGVAQSQEVINVGYNFDRGLANGMSNNSSIVSYAAAQVMRNAMASAKNAAVIQSPSKKMEEVGYFWDAGLAIGIFKNGKMIFDVVTETMQSAISQVKQSMSEMAGAIEDADVDYNPVITPVVDDDEAVRKLKHLNDILSGGTTKTMRLASVNAARNQKQGFDSNGAITNNNSTVNYVQNITSPRALRSRDIYRQTKNLIALQKGARA